MAESGGQGEPGAAPDLLSLADWRRQVADLYAEVRRLAARDPRAAWDHWKAARDRLYREHPQSPIPAADRPAFIPRYFPYDPALRFALPVLPAASEPEAAVTAALPTSGDAPMAFQRLGWVDVPFSAGVRRLALYWLAGYAGGLFLPFRDATAGQETYGAGRYLLDAAKSADLGGDERGALILDFNFAYQPSCAFDPRWLCPLTPPENRLDFEVRAGERLR